MWLRVNQQKNSRAQYQELLAAQQIDSATSEHPHALRLAQPQPVNALPQFDEGAVTVQDLHAQWSALLLEPQNDQWILDACAAPGGKTTHILEIAPQAKVIALDVEQNRLARVQQNLDRLGQQAQVVCGDASQPTQWLSELGQPDLQFERILLDAPCSATGVIRRHPDIKWLRQATDIEPLVELQGKILRALWQRLKPNGILLYATCSLLPEENAQQIEKFLAEQPDAQLVALPFEPQNGQIGQQFIPTEQGGDGFYYAKLRKVSKN